MKKTALLLMIFTILSKIMGFGREITLSYFYGASNISDAYLISLTIPGMIFSFIGNGLSTGYIPLYSKIVQQDGESEGNRYTNNLINLLLLICSGIILFGLLFTNQIVKVLASGFEGDTLAIAVQFTRIGLVGIYFTGLVNIFSGFLRVKGNFVIPESIGFPLNFFTIVAILLSTKTNIMVLAIGGVIATASQLVLFIPFLAKEGYGYTFELDLKDQYIREMVYMALPVIIGVSVNEINVLVDRTLASRIVVGGISALNYADKINGFVHGLFVATIATAMFPMISKMAAQGNIDGLKRTVSEAINLINLFVIPATVGALLFAEPIVRLLFGRGAFTAEAISMTANALFFYALGMIGFGLREILYRAFYSMQNTKTPMINASLSVVMNIILNLILSKFLGLGGLALATSLSALFGTGLLFISLRKKIGPFGMKNTIISLIKIVLSSLGMGVVAYLTYQILLPRVSGNRSLLVSIGVGTIVYFIFVYFMKIEEVDTLANLVRKRLKARA